MFIMDTGRSTIRNYWESHHNIDWTKLHKEASAWKGIQRHFSNLSVDKMGGVWLYHSKLLTFDDNLLLMTLTVSWSGWDLISSCTMLWHPARHSRVPTPREDWYKYWDRMGVKTELCSHWWLKDVWFTTTRDESETCKNSMTNIYNLQ